MNLKKVLERAEQEGICTRKELAIALFPDSGYVSRWMNFDKIMNNKNKTIRIDHIEKICEMCDCSPNELFEK